MKKLLCVVTVCALLTLLCACGESVKQGYESFCGGLAEKRVGFTAEVRAEYEDRRFDCTLSCAEEDGGCVVTVLKPESVAGVRVHVGENRSTVEFDGASLDTGALDKFGLTPLTGMEAILSALRAGHADTFWSEDEAPVVQLDPTDELTVTLWFDGGFTAPIRAELASGGRTVLFCELRDFSVTSRTDGRR